jgi:Holliday junction resolvasome RuvABC endonuclease subunit
MSGLRILGLDLSTNVGWCLWEGDGPSICRTERLPKAFAPEDYAARTWPLMEWLEGQLMVLKPEVIAFEAPFIPMAPVNDKNASLDGGKASFVTTQHTLRLQISLANTIETTAKKHGIRCFEVATSTAKKALTGFGRAPNGVKGWDWGDEMVIAATKRGWKVGDDHQADAAAVALVVFQDLRARAA